MNTTTPPLAFIDTETTGLDTFGHEAWEVAVIFDEGDLATEHMFRIKPSLADADPKALEINRYHERTRAADWKWDDPASATPRLHGLLDGVILIGSNPSFDAAMLSRLFGMHHPDWKANPAPWLYRTIDIATLAAGYLYGSLTQKAGGDRGIFVDEYPEMPLKSYDVSRAVGVEPPAPDVAHTALGDARWARAVFRAVVGGNSSPALGR